MESGSDPKVTRSYLMKLHLAEFRFDQNKTTLIKSGTKTRNC